MKKQKNNYFLMAFICLLLMFFVNFAANAQPGNGSEVCDSMATIQEGENTYFLYCSYSYFKYELTEQESLSGDFSNKLAPVEFQNVYKSRVDAYTRFFGGASFKEVIVICHNDVICARRGTEIFVTPLNNVTGLYRIICNPEDYKGEFVDYILVKVVDIERVR